MLGTPMQLCSVLATPVPQVKLLDLVSDATDQTIYTFTNTMCGEITAGTRSATVAGNAAATLSARSNKLLVAIIHAEDAAVTFSVSPATLGGVALTSAVDRGGGTNAINTAIFTASAETLADIANTDLVVTFSEAVTSCAVGLLLVENICWNAVTASASNTGTGSSLSGPSPGATTLAGPNVQIWGSTSVAAALGENVSIITTGGASTNTNMNGPTLLYEGSNAEMSYAAAWAYSLQYPGNAAFDGRVDWSGAGAHDHASCVIR